MNMNIILERFLSWLRTAVLRKTPEPVAAPSITSDAEGVAEVAAVPAEIPPAEPPVDNNEAATTAEQSGRWYFKRNILDRLDNYFHYIRLLQNDDPDAYDLYSRVGAYIYNTRVGYGVRYGDRRIDASWRVDGALPSFAMVVSDGEQHESGSNLIYPKLLYFQKVGRTYDVEPCADDVFRVTAYYVRRDKDHYRSRVTFYVAVDAENRPRILRERTMVSQSLPPTKASGYRKRFHAPITRVSWGLSRSLVDHASSAPGTDRASPESIGISIFNLVANMHSTCSADVHVKVSKGVLSALFCVDLLRTPYFFADRDTELATDGRRKRIFHIVKSHERTLSSGAKRIVKTHFRGERFFKWSGYDIGITMPGLHHNLLNRLSASADDVECYNGPEAGLTNAEVGAMLSDHMRAA